TRWRAPVSRSVRRGCRYRRRRRLLPGHRSRRNMVANVPAPLHAVFRRQHGVASVQQCHEAGLARSTLDYLLRRGDLVAVLRGVVASPSVELTELSRCAAVCVAHPRVVIAGPTAGRLWSFRLLPRDQRIHVIAPRHWKATVESWCRSYRTDAIGVDDVVHRADGIRLTTRQRTALDLSRFVTDDDRLLSIIEQAAHDGGLRDGDLRAVALDRLPGRPWVSRYLDVVDRRLAGPAAESDPEVRVGVALERAGVSGLQRQWPLDLPGSGRIRFDLALPDQQEAIEVDVFPTHRETIGQRRDRSRDAEVEQFGWTVHRIDEASYRRRFDTTVSDLARRLRSARHVA
ncbi:MAG: type IV toxin-antitoxin system AbiEi family antitoxin domain-containing protein, partial [Actinomycetota bacterium]